MISWWKTLCKIVWSVCGFGVKKNVEKSWLNKKVVFRCEKLDALAEKFCSFANKKGWVSGKQEQVNKRAVFALSTVST